MQTFGVRVADAFRKSKSAPWMERAWRIRGSTCIVGGLKPTSVPSSLAERVR